MSNDITKIEQDLEDIAAWLTLGVKETDIHSVYNPEFSNDWVRIAKAASYNASCAVEQLKSYIRHLEERLSKYEPLDKEV